MAIKTGKKRIAFLFAGAFLLIFAGRVYASNVRVNCVDCHDNAKFKTHYKKSIHGNIGCTGCHESFSSLDDHVMKKESPA